MQTPGLYINPLTDYGFKMVFGDEEIMREFLNDLLKPASPIRHVIFLNKDVQPENEALRGIVFYYLAHSISPQVTRAN